MPIEQDVFASHQPDRFNLTGYSAGKLFAKAAADVQAQFLLGLSDEVESWTECQSWAIQCRYIADEFAADRMRPIHVPEVFKTRIVCDLATLMEHLTEPRS